MNNTQAAFLRKAVLRWYAQRSPAAFSIAQIAAILQLSPIADFKATPDDLQTTAQDLLNRGMLKVVTVAMENDLFYTTTPAGAKAARTA